MKLDEMISEILQMPETFFRDIILEDGVCTYIRCENCKVILHGSNESLITESFTIDQNTSSLQVSASLDHSNYVYRHLIQIFPYFSLPI